MQCFCLLTDAAGGGGCCGVGGGEGSRAETCRGRVSSQGPSSSHPPAWPPALGPPCQQAAVSRRTALWPLLLPVPQGLSNTRTPSFWASVSLSRLYQCQPGQEAVLWMTLQEKLPLS